jgi:mono/diheme cytochrome c family protein
VRKLCLSFGAIFALAVLSFSAHSQSMEPGRKLEQTACIACHSLRLVESQRLSPAAWGKEIDKMAGWGAIVTNRQLLIEYLSSQYSDSKPVPVPPLSKSGVADLQ